MNENGTEKQRVIELLTRLGKAYIDKGRYDEAVEKFNQILTLGEENADVYLNISKAYIMKEQYDKTAIDIFRKTLKYEPDNKVLNVILSQCYLNENRNDDEAYRVYKKALQYNPKNKNEIEVALIKIDYKKGNYKSAKDVAENVLLNNPDTSDLLPIYIRAAWKVRAFHDIQATMKNIVNPQNELKVLRWLALNFLNAHYSEENFPISSDDISISRSYINRLKTFTNFEDVYCYIALRRFINDYKPNDEEERVEDNLISEYELFLTDNSFSNIWDKALTKNIDIETTISFSRDIWGRILVNGDVNKKKKKSDANVSHMNSMAVIHIAPREHADMQQIPAFYSLLEHDIFKDDEIRIKKLEDGCFILTNDVNRLAVNINKLFRKFFEENPSAEKLSLMAIIHHFEWPDDETWIRDLDLILSVQQWNRGCFQMDSSFLKNDERKILITAATKEALNNDSAVRTKLLSHDKVPHLYKSSEWHEIVWEDPLKRLRNGIVKKIDRLNILEELHLNDTFNSYKAVDSFLERMVIIKILRPDFTLNNGANVSENFFKSANIIGRLNHPNIAKIYDINEREGFQYIAREYVEGKEISSPLTIFKEVNWMEAIRLCLKIGNALIYAHKEGVVHSRIKPANIFISDAGEVKITDFSMPQFSIPIHKHEHYSMNSYCYLAPEQIHDAAVDERTDVYSLGVLLYELLIRKNPFFANDKKHLFKNINYVNPPSISSSKIEIPTMVDTVINKAITKKPDDRYPNMEQFANALENLLQ